MKISYEKEKKKDFVTRRWDLNGAAFIKRTINFHASGWQSSPAQRILPAAKRNIGAVQEGQKIAEFRKKKSRVINPLGKIAIFLVFRNLTFMTTVLYILR